MSPFYFILLKWIIDICLEICIDFRMMSMKVYFLHQKKMKQQEAIPGLVVDAVFWRRYSLRWSFNCMKALYEFLCPVVSFYFQLCKISAFFGTTIKLLLILSCDTSISNERNIWFCVFVRRKRICEFIKICFVFEKYYRFCLK